MLSVVLPVVFKATKILLTVAVDVSINRRLQTYQNLINSGI